MWLKRFSKPVVSVAVILGVVLGARDARSASLLDEPVNRVTAESWRDLGMSLSSLKKYFFDPAIAPESACLSEKVHSCFVGLNASLKAFDLRWQLRFADDLAMKSDRVIFQAGKLKVVDSQGTPVQPNGNSSKTKGRPVPSIKERWLRSGAKVADLVAVVDFMKSQAGGELAEAAAFNAFANAQVKALDPFASVVPSKLYDRLNSLPGTKSIQLGIKFYRFDKHLIITSVALDSKAFWAGFRQGDEILTLNNVPGNTLDSQRIMELISAETATWALKRNGETLTIVTTNTAHEKPKFESSVVLWKDQAYARLTLRTFQSDFALCTQISAKLEEMRSHYALSGIVLDLRANGGGLVAFARCVSTIFLGPDVLIANMRGIDKSTPDEVWQTLTSSEMDKQALKPDLQTPMAVLVDGGSASASELMAGALRDHHRAWLVGRLTYGKGSVNIANPWPFRPDAVLEFATRALFYQPNNTSNELVGIIPDFEVAPRFAGKDIPDLAYRNAELHPDLPFKVNEASPPPRPQEIARVKSCVDEASIKEKEAAMQASRVTPDHELFEALEVLRCSR